MSKVMKPVAFKALLTWIFEEYKQNDSIFGINSKKFYIPDENMQYFAGIEYETGLGIAAGPHSQCAQNIISAYLSGARFFELKTVQIEDKLDIAKPCIAAKDEGYNTEWSTELSVEEAYREYLKAWIILHLLKEYLKLSRHNASGFIFNMSVGYDIKGIKSPKIDDFINNLKDASKNHYFARCLSDLKEFIHNRNELHDFNAVVEKIPAKISESITLSTMHGCPPEDQVTICRYLLKEKKLTTLLKLNPTLLGFEYVDATLKNLGYRIELKRETFEHDLQYKAASQILKALLKEADQQNLVFGVKLSNTLPVVNYKQLLPGNEMYMSGKALFPLTINLAKKLNDDFARTLLISYCGGAEFANIKEIIECGIKPVTMATNLLKPGGYSRLFQMCNLVARCHIPLQIIPQKLAELAARAEKSGIIEKKIPGNIKIARNLPVFDCAAAGCSSGCPIEQNIPAYIRLVKEKKFAAALETIHRHNALPHITGSICEQPCRHKCTRLDYDKPLSIRKLKLKAAIKGYAQYLPKLKAPPAIGSPVAILGAKASTAALALVLRRAGMPVKIYEKSATALNEVREKYPASVLPDIYLKKDLTLLLKSGIEIEYESDPDLDDLLKNGYKYVITTDSRKENITAGVYNIDDGGKKPFSIVNSLAAGITTAKKILAAENLTYDNYTTQIVVNAELINNIMAEKGNIKPVNSDLIKEAERCLACDLICSKCVEVCPNRANINIEVISPHLQNHFQILHLDKLCNECGNCETFCPYEGKPYRNKFTLFANENRFRNSKNPGVFFQKKDMGLIRSSRQTAIFHNYKEFIAKDDDSKEIIFPQEIIDIVLTLKAKYDYLIDIQEGEI
jgi:putative selenate reductase